MCGYGFIRKSTWNKKIKWRIRRKSKPEWKNILVIFISSVVDDTSKRTAKSIGDDYLEKPFTFDDLNQKIKNINEFNPWVLRLIQRFPILESLL